MTPTTDPSEDLARDLGLGPAMLGATADPGFAVRLRRDVRAGQARATRNLGWFDLETPFATLRVVHDGQLVHLVTNDPTHFDAYAHERLGFEPRYQLSQSLREAIEAALAAPNPERNLVYLGALTPFQRAVLEATATIPAGHLRPYGWVARRVGSPGAVRATGTALGHNPVPFIVPCHRVVRGDWHLGQYSAAGGTATKERILRWEHVEPEEVLALAAKGRFVGDPASRAYCLPGCSGAHTIKNAIPFNTPEEAERAGFTPCPVCAPAP